MLFTANVNFMITQWPACAQTAHVMVSSFRKFENHWSRVSVAR
jgi:hypothetical protein